MRGDIMGQYNKGDLVEGIVTGIEDYGIFLLVDSNVTGLIHISEISNSFVRNVSDYAKINDKIKAKVIEYDEKENKLKLSIKDLEKKNPKKNHEIQETKSGFTNLKNQLNVWIEIKEKENNKK